MTPTEQKRMYEANCHCCLLAEVMKDCANCLFAQPATLTESVAVAYGQADLSPVGKVIVSKEFAKRWTDNLQHYKDYYGADEVEIQP